MNKDEIKVDKGLPIPALGRHNGSPFIEFLRSLEVGDSFVRDNSKLTAISSQAKTAGIKVAIRKEGDSHLRVWCVEILEAEESE